MWILRRINDTLAQSVVYNPRKKKPELKGEVKEAIAWPRHFVPLGQG